jgi:hypothetical protein
VGIQDNILYGIDAELKESQKPERFRIEAKQQEGSVWKVWLAPGELGGRLDESLEGAYAWWPGDQFGNGKGTADILSVVPEEEFVVLRFVTAPLPLPDIPLANGQHGSPSANGPPPAGGPMIK